MVASLLFARSWGSLAAAGPSLVAAARSSTRAAAASVAGPQRIVPLPHWQHQAGSLQITGSRCFSKTAERAAEGDSSADAAAENGQQPSSSQEASSASSSSPSSAPLSWSEITAGLSKGAGRSIRSDEGAERQLYGAPPASRIDGHGDGATNEDAFEAYWQNRATFGKPADQRESMLSRSAAGPSAGRTVTVDGNAVSLTRAMAMLNGIISRNNVRLEKRLQAFHEKPSQMRRRLASTRHRRRFANMVREKVKLVTELQRKGA